MTEHLTLNTVVHAAFRRTLHRFDAALAAFPAEPDPRAHDRAHQLGRAWDFLDEELHHHHNFEEEYFWPALEKTDADLSALADLDHEHEAMRAALGDATATMNALRSNPTATNAATTRAAVTHLREVLLNHLDHEEKDLEPISAAYQDSAPMQAAIKQVKKAHLRNMGNFVEWLQDGADADDRAGLRKEIPAPVLFLFATVGGRRYRREIAPVWAV